MKIHHTDQDQITMLKDWWRNYGKGLTIAVVLGILLGYGVRFWHVHRDSVMQKASIQYQTLLETYLDKPSNIKSVHSMAQNLKAHYARTPYAPLASLFLAKSYVAEEKYNEALTELSWILQHSQDKTFKQIARLRSARILLAQNKTDQALNLLNTIDDSTYQPYVDLIKGDIYQTQQTPEKAQESFEQASIQLNQMQIPYELLPLIQSTPPSTSS